MLINNNHKIQYIIITTVNNLKPKGLNNCIVLNAGIHLVKTQKIIKMEALRNMYKSKEQTEKNVKKTVMFGSLTYFGT